MDQSRSIVLASDHPAIPVTSSPITSGNPVTLGLSIDARQYASVTIACVLAGTVASSLKWSPDNITFVDATAVDLNFQTQNTIGTVQGAAITVPARAGYLKLVGGNATLIWSAGS